MWAHLTGPHLPPLLLQSAVFLFGKYCCVDLMLPPSCCPCVCLCECVTFTHAHLQTVPTRALCPVDQNKPVNHTVCIFSFPYTMKCKYHRRCQATTQLYLSGGIGEKAARVEDIYSVWFIYTNYFSANSEKAKVDFVSSRREKSSRMPRPVVVGLCWYPLTPALSLVGRGAVEYRAPQVMLHMACSLLRRIKCQL